MATSKPFDTAYLMQDARRSRYRRMLSGVASTQFQLSSLRGGGRGPGVGAAARARFGGALARGGRARRARSWPGALGGLGRCEGDAVGYGARRDVGPGIGGRGAPPVGSWQVVFDPSGSERAKKRAGPRAASGR